MSRDTPHRPRSERRDSNAAGLADRDTGSTVTEATTLVGAAARAHDLGGFQQQYLDRIGAMVDASAYGFYVHDPAGGPATEPGLPNSAPSSPQSSPDARRSTTVIDPCRSRTSTGSTPPD